MNVGKPLVSIYVVSKNRPELLRRAICSCLAQTYRDIEVIVVDDASDSFDFRELINSFSDSRISSFRLSEPAGANVCRNLAIKHANGKYITGLDDDDYFHPKRLEILTQEYAKRDVSFVSSRFLFHAEKMNSIVNWLKELSIFNMNIDIIKMLNTNVVGNQILTETNKLRRIGGFDKNIKAFQDYDTWLRLITEFGGGVKISKSLYFKEFTQDSITAKNMSKLDGLEDIVRKMPNIFSKYPHCVTLHKLIYKDRKIGLNNFFKLFKKNNRIYLLKLVFRRKIYIGKAN